MNLGQIRTLAEDSLIDAKLILNEEGADVYRKPLDKMIELSKRMNKQDLARMTNSEVFLIFLHLANGTIYSYYESLEFVEEIKQEIDSWTYERNGRDLNILINNMDDNGNLTSPEATKSFMNLNLTAVFFNYNMRSVYSAILCFLKFKSKY